MHTYAYSRRIRGSPGLPEGYGRRRARARERVPHDRRATAVCLGRKSAAGRAVVRPAAGRHLPGEALHGDDGQMHGPEPESRNVWPSMGMNSQSYFPLLKVSFRTPYVVPLKTSLLACVWPRL